MGWLRLVGSLKLWVSVAKEPNKRDHILQKRPIILRSLLIVATRYVAASIDGSDRRSLSHTHIPTHALSLSLVLSLSLSFYLFLSTVSIAGLAPILSHTHCHILFHTHTFVLSFSFVYSDRESMPSSPYSVATSIDGLDCRSLSPHPPLP